MTLFTTATLSWFDDGCCDVRYLDIWKDAPASYVPGRTPVGNSWFYDSHEETVACNARSHTFRRVRNLLLDYEFYPPTWMSTASDFGCEQRLMRVGDRIVQRHHLFHLSGFSLLDIIGLVEIHAVWDEPRRVGFSSVTVSPHVTQGEWTITATWQNNGDIVLGVRAVSRPVPGEPRRNHRFLRNWQQVAYHRGITYFKQLLCAT